GTTRPYRWSRAGRLSGIGLPTVSLSFGTITMKCGIMPLRSAVHPTIQFQAHTRFKMPPLLGKTGPYTGFYIVAVRLRWLNITLMNIKTMSYRQTVVIFVCSVLLTGNFWHIRQTLFGRDGGVLPGRLPC